MRAVGLDPALRNFGMVAGTIYDQDGQWAFRPIDMQLVTTEGAGKTRTVRKSSENVERGQHLHNTMHEFLETHNPDMVFVEVPSGAQSASAAAALGLVVGVLCSIRHPLIEVAPIEIKRLFVTKNQAVPKARVMEWAYKCWPGAKWLTHGNKRTLANEHLADACASVVAGLRTPTFKQLLAMRGLHEIPLSADHRHPSGGQPKRRVPMGTVSVDQRADQTVRRKVPANPW